MAHGVQGRSSIDGSRVTAMTQAEDAIDEAESGHGRTRTALWLVASALFVAGSAAAVALAGFVSRDEGAVREAQVAAALGAFRSEAAHDLRRAATAHGGDALAERLAAYDETLWPMTPARVGWSWLLSTAVPTVAGGASDRPLAALYNPWADVLVVLEWRRDGGRLELVDLDVMPADCVRRGGRAPFAFEVSWERADRFPPAALLASSGDTLRAFRKQWPQGAPRTGWRAGLAPGGEAAWTRVVRPAAGLLCARALIAITEYRHPGKGEPALLSALRPPLDRALRAARSGRGAARGLAVTSILVGKKRVYALAVDPERPGRAVAFSFDAGREGLVLRRVDALDLGRIAGAGGGRS
jgi:hypothetical protein